MLDVTKVPSPCDVMEEDLLNRRIPERVESAQQTVILLKPTKNRIRLIPQMPLS